MPSIGGSIESITLNNRVFAVAADADGSRKLGGFENEVLANGDGTARIQKTRVPCQLDGIVVQIDDTKGDQEFLQEVADNNDFVPAAINLASGAIWQGQMIIQGELMFSTMTATATVNLRGTGKFTAQ